MQVYTSRQRKLFDKVVKTFYKRIAEWPLGPKLSEVGAVFIRSAFFVLSHNDHTPVLVLAHFSISWLDLIR